MKFAYTTISRLRGKGIGDIVTIPDAEVQDIIESVSEWINQQTLQWYQPTPAFKELNGNSNLIMRLPSFIPIQEISSITIDTTRNRSVTHDPLPSPLPLSSTGLLSLSDTVDDFTFDQGGRTFYRNGANFPQGVKNILLNCIVGWLEKSSLKLFETTLNANFDTDIDTSITLTELSNTSGSVEVGDIITIIVQAPTRTAKPDYINLLVTGFSTSTLEVNFEPYIPFNLNPRVNPLILSGNTVKIFGRIPKPIIELTDFMSLKLGEEYVENTSEVTDGLTASQRKRLISEKVDSYSYKLDRGISGTIEADSVGALTGSSRMDFILSKFRKPAVMELI